jgi:hypothetical protein
MYVKLRFILPTKKRLGYQAVWYPFTTDVWQFRAINTIQNISQDAAKVLNGERPNPLLNPPIPRNKNAPLCGSTLFPLPLL